MKLAQLFESVHPDVAKKEREKARLIASGYPKDHSAIQKINREIARLKQQTKGSTT